MIAAEGEPRRPAPPTGEGLSALVTAQPLLAFQQQWDPAHFEGLVTVTTGKVRNTPRTLGFMASHRPAALRVTWKEGRGGLWGPLQFRHPCESERKCRGKGRRRLSWGSSVMRLKFKSWPSCLLSG